MSKIILSTYSLSELRNLQSDLELEIKSRTNEELQKAREKILAIAEATGVSVKEILAFDQKKIKTDIGQKVQVRYQNPDDNAKTWTGRGRQPKWIAEGLAVGKSLDHFRI